MMKKITMKKAAGLTLLLLCLAAATLFTQDSLPVISGFVKQSDGKELYRSIFFAEGDLAGMIPMIAGHQVNKSDFDPKAVEYIDAVREKIVLEIELNHPDFFASFKKRMLSGDHVKISQALQEGIEYSNDVYRKFRGNTSYIAKVAGIIIETEPPCYWGMCWSMWITASPRMSVFSFPITETKHSNDPLAVDQLVNSIASALKQNA
jgi:hypothetical protein